MVFTGCVQVAERSPARREVSPGVATRVNTAVNRADSQPPHSFGGLPSALADTPPTAAAAPRGTGLSASPPRLNEKGAPHGGASTVRPVGPPTR